MQSPLPFATTTSSSKERSRILYETYLLELDEFRILAGRLDELQVSGLWPDLLPKRSSSTTGKLDEIINFNLLPFYLFKFQKTVATSPKWPPK